MKSSKRKRRSDKFPLTLHPTGQYCTVRRSKEEFVTLELTRKKHSKDTWPKRHIYTEVKA